MEPVKEGSAQLEMRANKRTICNFKSLYILYAS
jgi:hypothetical protein